MDSPLVDEVFSDAGDAADTGLFWAVTDHAGSVRDVLRGDDVFGGLRAHDLVNHIEYDSYGDILLAIDSSKQSVDELAIDAAFAGRDWDDDADLYYNRARWYDASTSRFISQDPIGFAGGDTNLYRYAGGDPVNFSDPSGLFLKKLWRETKRVINDVVDFVEDTGDYVEEKYKDTVRSIEYIARNPEDAFKSAIKDPMFWAGLAFGPMFSASFSYGFFNVNLGLNGLSTGIDFLGFGKQALSAVTGGGFNLGLPSVNIASPVFNYAASIDVGAFARSSSGTGVIQTGGNGIQLAGYDEEDPGFFSERRQNSTSLGALSRESGLYPGSGGGDKLRQNTAAFVETGLGLMPGAAAVEAVNLAGGQNFSGGKATWWDYAAAPFTAVGAGIGYVGKKAGGLFFKNADTTADFTSELIGSSQTARRHLRASVSGSGGQAHHIIPWQSRNHELVQKAARGGFNINGSNNGIRLQLDQHLGSHPRYNAAVTGRLDKIISSSPDISDIDAAASLQNYADQLRDGLLRSSNKIR